MNVCASHVVPMYEKFYEKVLSRPAYIPPPLAPPEGLA